LQRKYWTYVVASNSGTLYVGMCNGNFLDVTATGINNEGVVVGYAGTATGQFVGLELKGSTFKQVRIPGAYSTRSLPSTMRGQSSQSQRASRM
jgi:hypothetical protein